MAAKVKNSTEDNKFVKLIVYKKRRLVVILTALILTAIFGAWIFIKISRHSNQDWFGVGFPMMILGLLTVFLLPSEEWSYGPWQNGAQKYEKNIYN